MSLDVREETPVTAQPAHVAAELLACADAVTSFSETKGRQTSMVTEKTKLSHGCYLHMTVNMGREEKKKKKDELMVGCLIPISASFDGSSETVSSLFRKLLMALNAYSIKEKNK